LINLAEIDMNNNKGFSLVEVLVVVAFSSIVLAIGVPNMTSFLYRQKLNSAGREIYQGIRAVQGEAMRRKETWQISFRNNNGRLEWAKHHLSTPLNRVGWTKIEDNIELDEANSINWSVNRTTYTPLGSSTSVQVTFLRFNQNGNFVDTGNNLQRTNVSPARITIKPSRNVDTANFAKRCVIIQTVIGAMRQEKDNNCR